MTMTFVVMGLGTVFNALVNRRDPTSGLTAPVVKALAIGLVPVVDGVPRDQLPGLQAGAADHLAHRHPVAGLRGLAALLPLAVEVGKVVRRRRTVSPAAMAPDAAVAPERARRLPTRRRGARLGPVVCPHPRGEAPGAPVDVPFSVSHRRQASPDRRAGYRRLHFGGVQMTTQPTPEAESVAQGSKRLMVLLAMAMFVLVVDTSLMNVSISAVIKDLDTTASGVQSAIALEALVSAAFILINSKVGDLIGRKRAYVLGLLAYAVGALAMTLAQSLTAIIIFWAIIGGLGASLLLPAMQSLIHGNFAGAAQKQAYALVGAAAAIAAAVGPLLGGFVTTYLSWRVGFALEVVIIAVVLSQIRLVRDVAVHRLPRDRHGRRGPVGRRHGRRGARHPGLAGGRRVRRAAHGGRRRRPGLAGSVAGPAQARRAGSPCSTRTCSGTRTSPPASRARCCSRSRSAAP